MAHPKRKISKTRRDKRRTHDKIEVRPAPVIPPVVPKPVEQPKVDTPTAVTTIPSSPVTNSQPQQNSSA